MRVYLDNAATSPLDPAVIEAMTKAMTDLYGNASSIHSDGRKARAAIEGARKTIANYLNASIGEIFFTSGGTESNNMTLKCAVRDMGVERIITSPIEHHCILHTVETLKKQGTEIVMMEVCQKGHVDLNQLSELLANSPKKTLVSLMHGNNEIGTMLDLDQVSEICQAHNALFHSDTVQTIGQYKIDVDKTKIHFLSGSGHKFHGPKGTGFIYINGNCSLKPLLDGGSQERNMRAGTENIYGIVGLAKAFQLAQDNMADYRAHIEDLRDYMKDTLENTFEDIQFNGNQNGSGNSLYKVLSVSFPPSPKSEMLLLNLDILGISASGGSACSSGAEVGSHVLTGIKSEIGRKTIRFSFSHFNTKEEIDYVIEKLKTIVKVKNGARATVSS